MPNLTYTISVFDDGSTDVVDERTPPVEETPVPSYTHRVKRWGEDDVMKVQYGRDSAKLEGGSNFQVISLFVPGTGTWSAVTNHVVLGRGEINYLMNLQTLYGAPTGTFDQRMNWLVYEGKGKRPYWDGSWRIANRFEYGTMLWGGSFVQIVGEKVFRTFTPGSATKRDIRMGLVRMFTKADFALAVQGKITPKSHPHLIPQCSAVSADNNYNPTPKGFTMFSPIWGGDWGGNLPSRDFYIPFECLVKVNAQETSGA